MEVIGPHSYRLNVPGSVQDVFNVDLVVMDDDMYSIYLRGKVYVHLCTVQIGVRLSTWYVLSATSVHFT